MGLPGSGKTTLARAVLSELHSRDHLAQHFDADEARAAANDWDMSIEGRLRQARRMGTFSHARMITIADFICPTAETLTAFEAESPADLIIWMNTIQASRYPDTDAMFQPPVRCDIRVRTWAEDWPQQIAAMIVDGKKPPQWNPKAPTAQMLGRFQPWHS